MPAENARRIVEQGRIVEQVRSLRVFLSSPFSEPFGQRWPLRESLRESLKEHGVRPWLYEVDAKNYRRRGLPPHEIIIDAIKNSDLIITLYKSRAGSYLANEPFVATAFETFHARRMGKPVYLHMLGDRQLPRLHGLLSIFGDPLIVPDCAATHRSETELTDAVLSDVKKLRWQWTVRKLKWALLSKSSVEMVHEWDWLRDAHSSLVDAIQQQDYWRAATAASTVPLIVDTSRLSKDKRIAYATILAMCANVWANQARYQDATQNCRLSIRQYMELGYPYEMLAQVQALSGILNMANEVRQAYWVNTFGLQSAARLSHSQALALQLAFNDSRGSIMRKLGRFSTARERLRKSMATPDEGTPYSLAKYATALSSLGGQANIDTSVRLLQEVALPLSISQGQSIGYVKRDAAGLAVIVGDFERASRLLADAEQYCEQKGHLHTLAAVRRMNAPHIRSLSPPAAQVD